MVFQVILALSQKEYNIDLTETHFSLLEKFISKRKEESGEEGWLEIKPKNDSRSGKQYDIQDYNQLKRLINALLDGMYGKGNWSRDIHWNALKDKLFEKSENFPRLIRLRNL